MCLLNDTATTEIYTLSLHDALPISLGGLDHHRLGHGPGHGGGVEAVVDEALGDVLGGDAGLLFDAPADRKSTRLNSSPANISFAVFSLSTPIRCMPYHISTITAYYI